MKVFDFFISKVSDKLNKLHNKNYFTVRDSAKKYYDELNKAGILFYNYTDCAIKINKISND